MRQTGTSRPYCIPSGEVASAASSSNSNVLGIVIGDISAGSIGLVAITGSFKPWDTSAYSLNDPVYLSDTGEMSPTAGTVAVIIGSVKIVDANNGCIFIGDPDVSLESCC